MEKISLSLDVRGGATAIFPSGAKRVRLSEASAFAVISEAAKASKASEPSTEAWAEAARLEALRRYAILDTPQDAAFDDFSRLAAHICGTPIALITLLDTDRQWFKSHHGTDVQEVKRNIAFCHHAIQFPLSPQPLIVRDTLTDARFAENPLVTSDPNIRFYAGAPIVTPDGHALGTVCVIDRIPRDLTPEQADALSALSRQVMLLIEMRQLARDQQQILMQRQLSQVALLLAHDLLEQKVADRTETVQTQFVQALESLSSALEAKDVYTSDHSTRVRQLAVALAQAVRPNDTELARRVDIAARLHDIGKIGVPEAIIHKPGRLSHEEFQVIQKHPAIGSGILLPLIQDETVLAFVRHHHESWDGTGYPDGLAGSSIALGARILAVADAFDAMTSTRPYRPALTEEAALETLAAGAGQQWDPAIVDALIRYWNEKNDSLTTAFIC